MKRFVLIAIALTTFSAAPSQAASITFDLNCVIGHPTGGDVQCGVPSYGTVTFDDSPGNGDVKLTVALEGTGEKFKDLYFNYTGSAVAITAGADSTNLLDPDGVSHGPYTGKFDVGGTALAGTDPFSTTLYGWNSAGNNADLVLSDFQVLDSLNQTYLAVHIQGLGPDGCSAGGPPCTPGSNGGYSMNAIGSNGAPGTSTTSTQASAGAGVAASFGFGPLGDGREASPPPRVVDTSPPGSNQWRCGHLLTAPLL